VVALLKVGTPPVHGDGGGKVLNNTHTHTYIYIYIYIHTWDDYRAILALKSKKKCVENWSG
jgi:hypothetical protein